MSAACSSGDDDGETPPPQPSGVTIKITDAEQYTSQADLEVPVVETASTNITVNWAAVTSDLQCHAVMPSTDIINTSFIKFAGMTHDQVEEELAKSRLDSRKTEVFERTVTPADGNQAKLQTYFKGNGAIDIARDFAVGADASFLLIAQTSTGFGVGTKSMAFVVPTAGGGDTVNITTGCPTPPILTFDAHLADKPKIAFTDEGKWVAGWTDVTKDGTGGEIALANVDQLLVGFYPGMMPTDLEDDFFDIEQLAMPMYEMDIKGTDLKADLAKAVKRLPDGTLGTEKFAGFKQQTQTGTWMVALMCTTCPNPQPVVLAILEPS